MDSTSTTYLLCDLYKASLCLSFFMCEMGVITIAPVHGNVMRITRVGTCRASESMPGPVIAHPHASGGFLHGWL